MASGTPRKASVRRMAGKQLLGTVRQHSVVTDRPVDEGGTDTGCTSGEVLLLAIGSCSAGSLRNFFEARGVPCAHLSVDVFFEPCANAGGRDRIVIEVNNPGGGPDRIDAGAIRSAATAGAVTSRIKLGSEVEVRIAGASAAGGP